MRTALALASVLSATTALAQDAGPEADWEVLRDAAKDSTFAFVTFDSGLTVATRCIDGSYSALIKGLPEAPRRQDTRILRISVGDEEYDEMRWNVTTDRTAAVADLPAPFARDLRKGGRLQIVVPDGAGPGRNLRYDLALPPSNTAVDETLTACNRPLVDARDNDVEVIGENGLPANITWATPPRPAYPRQSRYAAGLAVATCMAQPDGRLTDCVIEMEHPDDGLFGDAVLRAMPRARIRSDVEAEGRIEPRLMAFRVIFKMR